ncbi:SigE family RNA polymerase sigma factor [Nitriliruptor alkaliphilus]|uniref:SigE family RNA polymerase sigma factor n=1 Tax=Nitriliruptor alkaliphilus TaxID=427918 RepID=UPI001FE13E6F|nr:SigE family RNA polymerase sigma factor [Nitriliruptor alkaliphilus]
MVRAGTDEQGFAAVFAAERQRAAGLAYLLVNDAELAEDVVADVFARILVRWRRGEIRDVAAYVRRAVVNEARSKLRRRYLERRVGQARSGDDRGVRLVDDHAADRDQVWQALRRLPVPQRTVLVLRYYEDLSEAQTAEVLGVSVGTVKSRASRGIARLEELVEDPRVADGAVSRTKPAGTGEPTTSGGGC